MDADRGDKVYVCWLCKHSNSNSSIDRSKGGGSCEADGHLVTPSAHKTELFGNINVMQKV